jgi:heme-degrading monooxygenase HmoA
MTVAKLIRGTIDPDAVDTAAAAVMQELAPRFLELPGARQGYWMADRASGNVLIVTTWSDEAAMQMASAADGRQRARIAERVGLHTRAVHSLEAIASHHDDPIGIPVFRWARATWVEGLSPQLAAQVPARRPAVVADQARSPGYRGSHWLARTATGDGLALSFWDTEQDVRASAGGSRRRRRGLEREFRFRVDRVEHFEGIGVALAASAEPSAASA